MPEPLWLYLTALLYFTRISTCSTIARVCENASHDRSTRMLNGHRSGHIFLELTLRTLFAITGGYLIVDNTVV